MNEKFYRVLLKGGILLSFIAFLIVNSNYYFPFITTKQLFFNVLIEFLTIFWIVLIIKFPKSRPKGSFVTYGLIAYFVAVLITCFTGVDFNLSFWGDLERMLGWFHITHFLFFYLIIITVFTTWKDWKYLFNTTLVATVIISLYGIITQDPVSTIGQNAYVAGLMIFEFYFAIILFLKTDDLYEKIWYVTALFFVIWGFIHSDVSGAQVGLFASLVVFALGFSLLHKNKKIKYGIIASLIVGISVCVGLYMNIQNPIFDNTKIGKIFRDLSLSNRNLNTRLLSWKSAVDDFPNHVLLGTGYGNFAITFDKSFPKEFILYAELEENFDRAHNNIIDIGSTTGLLGLITYLSIFIGVAYYLIKGYKDKKLKTSEFVIISSIIVGYFVHNLAVFDALVNYMVLMSTLGYLHYLYNKTSDIKKEKTELSYDMSLFSVATIIIAGFIIMSIPTGGLINGALQYLLLLISFFVLTYLLFLGDIQETKIKFSTRELLSIAGGCILFFPMIYFVNMRTSIMMGDVITGIKYWYASKPEEAYNYYKKGLSIDSPLNRDTAGSFTDLVSKNPEVLSSLSFEKHEEILLFATELAEQNSNNNLLDYNMQMSKSLIYLNVAVFYQGSGEEYKDESEKYYQKSIDSIEISINSAGYRSLPRVVRANIYMTKGDYQKGLQYYKELLEMNTNYRKSYCYLAKAQFDTLYLTNNENIYNDLTSDRYEIFKTCYMTSEPSIVSWDYYLIDIYDYFYEKGDYEFVSRLGTDYGPKYYYNEDFWYKYVDSLIKQGQITEALDKSNIFINKGATTTDRVRELIQ